MLQVEGLEKRLGLGLARSRSRSRLVANIRRLGLVSYGLVYIPAYFIPFLNCHIFAFAILR